MRIKPKLKESYILIFVALIQVVFALLIVQPLVVRQKEGMNLCMHYQVLFLCWFFHFQCSLM